MARRQKVKEKTMPATKELVIYSLTYLSTYFTVFISLYYHFTDFPPEPVETGEKKKGKREYSLMRLYEWMKL